MHINTDRDRYLHIHRGKKERCKYVALGSCKQDVGNDAWFSNRKERVAFSTVA